MAVTVVTRRTGYGFTDTKTVFATGTGFYVRDGHLGVHDQNADDIGQFAPERWISVHKDDLAVESGA